MDFIEYAKWGIRVKEEPGTLGSFHQDKRNENKIGGLQRGWMCKFPCDTQGAWDTASATTNLPHDLLEPFEMSPVNFLEERSREYLNLHDSGKFTGSTVAEGNNNTIHQDHPAHIIQQDVSMKDYAVFRSTLEENNSVTSLTSRKESLEDDEKQILDAVLNERCDNSQDLPPTVGQINQREFFQCFPKSTASRRPNDESLMVKNQNEILCPSDMELLFEPPENSVVELVKNGTGSGRMEMSMNVEDDLSREIESLTEEHVATAHQENNNDFRISEISSFECPDCGEVLKSFNGFITHMNSHVIQQSENIDTVSCENCGKKFDDDQSLFLHKRECSSEMESNLVPLQKNHHHINNDNGNNNDIYASVNCFGTNSPVSNKQLASENNPELAFSSHGQDMPLKKFPEQPRYHNDVSSCSPKQRRQVYTDECSSSKILKGRNNWTMQNLGAADDAFDVSWSSEIQCRDKREGRNLGSVSTLSLRLFRFRRPRVVVKRAKVPVRSESVIKTVNSSLEDSVSNSSINPKSVREVQNAGNLKRLSRESVTSGVNKIPKSNSKVVSCSSIVHPCRKPKHVIHTEKECHFVRQHKSTDAKKCYSQANLTPGRSEPQNESVICDTPFSFSAEVSEKNKKLSEPVVNASKFPTEDTKVRSNLKIKIKPVVVLDRLSSLNFNSNQSSPENTSKCIEGESLQNNFLKEKNISIGSNVLEKCEDPSIETNSKKLEKTLVDQSARHRDPCHNAINELENSLTDLEKRYGIKKCYVKLKRISVESCDLRKLVKHNRDETGSEIKTCGKIKLRRTSSKLWTVSSCSALENTGDAEYTEDRMKTSNWLCVAKDSDQYCSDQEVHNEIYGQRSKKCFDSKDSSVGLRESAEETLNYIRRGKHMKRFRSECSCCQKIFFDEQDLAQHLESHLSGYKCPNCSARFHFVMELHTHVAGCSLASLLDCHKAKSLIKPCHVIL